MRKLFEAPDVIFEIDEDHHIFSFTWNGLVSESSVKRVLTLASRACVVMDNAHWLLDRRNLEGYSPEARIWLKSDFMNEIGQELIDKTDRIAAVNSELAMSQVSSKVLIEALLQLNNKIEYKEFDVLLPALNWLRNIETESVPVIKKSFFKRK